MLLRNVKITAVLLSAVSLFVFQAGVFAQTTTSKQLQDEKIQLEQQLADIESQIANYEKQLTDVRSQKNTLANKIKQLKTQSAALALKIKQTTLEIQKLNGQITQTQEQIDLNNRQIALLKSQISSLMQMLYEQDHRSLLDIVLSEITFSDLYTKLYDVQKINQSIATILDQVKIKTAILSDKHKQLSDQKEQQQNLVAIVTLQNQKLSQNISDQNSLLTKTKGKESNYQAALSDTKKKASEIRGRIYDLFNVGKQVTFGEAVTVAQWASGFTGVRAAYLLAILTQESNLGKNVGTCNRPGDPVSKSWRTIMKPDRDQKPFLTITKELGLNPDVTPVSCPMRDKNGNQIGWGGAMGPAQFIPSTWMGYKDDITGLTSRPADPWDIRDAFLAASLKLAAGGAKTQAGEWKAAMLYFSGSTNIKYRFYGDNVVAMAAQYQNDIDTLNR